MSNFSELYTPDLSNIQSRMMLPQIVKPGTNRRSVDIQEENSLHSPPDVTMRFLSDNPNTRDLSYKGGLKVIAAGLSRCATSSLQHALENDLGFNPCMHMAYIAPHASLLKKCHDALLETDKAKRQKILHELFDGYLATTDFPGMVFAGDLMEMYPRRQRHPQQAQQRGQIAQEHYRHAAILLADAVSGHVLLVIGRLLALESAPGGQSLLEPALRSRWRA
jgi:hypothetical protein